MVGAAWLHSVAGASWAEELREEMNANHEHLQDILKAEIQALDAARGREVKLF